MEQSSVGVEAREERCHGGESEGDDVNESKGVENCRRHVHRQILYRGNRGGEGSRPFSVRDRERMHEKPVREKSMLRGKDGSVKERMLREGFPERAPCTCSFRWRVRKGVN